MHSLFLPLTLLYLKYVSMYSAKCNIKKTVHHRTGVSRNLFENYMAWNKHIEAQRQLVLDLRVLSDSLWYEGRDMEAWPRILRGQKANGFLNSCRSMALKHVIPVDKLPTEELAPTVMKLLCCMNSWTFMSTVREGLNEQRKGNIITRLNVTNSFFRSNSLKGRRVEMGYMFFNCPAPMINSPVLCLHCGHFYK